MERKSRFAQSYSTQVIPAIRCHALLEAAARVLMICGEKRYKCHPGQAICRTPAPASRKSVPKPRSASYTASCRHFRQALEESFFDLRAFRVPSV